MYKQSVITYLAQIVVKNNLDNYRSNCLEDDVKPTSEEFANFGTEETVSDVLRDLFDEVYITAQKIQENIGPVLFDEDL